MTETPYLPLLNRDEVAVHINAYLAPTVNLLREITNYGTSLIPRCLVSSDRTLTELVVIGTLLRQVVAMVDAVEILISTGAVYPAHLQARALFESSLSIDWILKNDSAIRARHYYVSQLRNDRRWAERTQPGSDQLREFEEEIPAENRGPIALAAKHQIDEIDRLLALPAYSKINEALARARGNRKHEQPWYLPLGIKNLRQLAKAVDRETAYRSFYSLASEAVHGVNTREHVQVGKGMITLTPLRHLAGIQTLLRFVVPTVIHTYMAVLGKYRTGELAAFSRKYKEEWRGVFWSIPDVKYNPKAIRKV